MRSGSDYVPEKKAAPVEIGLINGASLKGKVWAPVGKSLADTLNAAQAFLEFTPFGDDELTYYLAKAHIVTLSTIDIPKAALLFERRGVVDADDPHHILGVAPEAPWHTIREAYLELTKAYHPDRFAGVTLPNEVTEYLGVKTRRINAAYAALEAPLRAANLAAAETHCATG